MIFHFKGGDEASILKLGKDIRKAAHDGNEYVIEMTRNRPIKSLSQNRYLFGVVYKEIAIATGHSAEEIHEMMKFKFNHITIEFPNGMREIVPGSTKDFSDAEMVVFTNKVKEWAKMYFNIKFIDQKDVDYLRWSELRDGYDKHRDAMNQS